MHGKKTGNAMQGTLFVISSAVLAMVICRYENVWAGVALYWLVLCLKNGMEACGK